MTRAYIMPATEHSCKHLRLSRQHHTSKKHTNTSDQVQWNRKNHQTEEKMVPAYIVRHKAPSRDCFDTIARNSKANHMCLASFAEEQYICMEIERVMART
jgi:hypothetical protein